MFGLHSSFRAFAALLLLVGLMLGGAIDAAACEPELNTHEFVEVQADPQDQDSPKQGGTDDACVHGHCHHCAQTVVKIQDVQPITFIAVAPTAIDQAGLIPIVGLTPKRPPRA